MFWQEADVLTNGIRLHYYRSGGDKPPIVMTHGITDSGRCWPFVSAALMPSYDLIAVDIRGHGKSEKPETGYAREIYARDVAGLIEALGLPRPALIGHSMGANTGATLASLYPDRLSALVLEDPPWRKVTGTSGQAHAAEMAQQIAARKQMSMEELLRQGQADNPKWQLEEFEPWIEAKLQVSPSVVSYVGAASSSWQGIVDKIRCPTLLLTADPALDARITPEVAADIHRLNPSIEIVNIPGAGHNIRREQLGAYLSAVQAFLAREYPSA